LCRIDRDRRYSTGAGVPAKIALTASGVAIPRPGSPIAALRENVKLTTASEHYSWVNTVQIWGVGSVDLAAGEINIKAYLPD
jgi:hypothetical protein